MVYRGFRGWEFFIMMKHWRTWVLKRKEVIFLFKCSDGVTIFSFIPWRINSTVKIYSYIHVKSIFSYACECQIYLSAPLSCSSTVQVGSWGISFETLRIFRCSVCTEKGTCKLFDCFPRSSTLVRHPEGRSDALISVRSSHERGYERPGFAEDTALFLESS